MCLWLIESTHTPVHHWNVEQTNPNPEVRVAALGHVVANMLFLGERLRNLQQKKTMIWNKVREDGDQTSRGESQPDEYYLSM